MNRHFKLAKRQAKAMKHRKNIKRAAKTLFKHLKNGLADKP